MAKFGKCKEMVANLPDQQRPEWCSDRRRQIVCETSTIQPSTRRVAGKSAAASPVYRSFAEKMESLADEESFDAPSSLVVPGNSIVCTQNELSLQLFNITTECFDADSCDENQSMDPAPAGKGEVDLFNEQSMVPECAYPAGFALVQFLLTALTCMHRPASQRTQQPRWMLTSQSMVTRRCSPPCWACLVCACLPIRSRL